MLYRNSFIGPVKKCVLRILGILFVSWRHHEKSNNFCLLSTSCLSCGMLSKSARRYVLTKAIVSRKFFARNENAINVSTKFNRVYDSFLRPRIYVRDSLHNALLTQYIMETARYSLSSRDARKKIWSSSRWNTIRRMSWVIACLVSLIRWKLLFFPFASIRAARIRWQQPRAWWWWRPRRTKKKYVADINEHGWESTVKVREANLGKKREELASCRGIDDN